MDEIVKIIRIESDGAEQTVASLVNEIKNLTEAMHGVEKGTEEYSNILKDLISNQEKLGKAMKSTKQETTAAEGSYNALVKQMAALKKQWRETTDEASRKELGNQIKDINGKLKNMDASIGNFQRNVGNYADGVKSAFGSMSGAAKGMVGPLNSVKAGLTAISSHPIVAVLTALSALLINGIAKGFKSSEENTNKLREAFSGFQAIGDAVTNMFQKLAGWIGNVANAAVNLADKLGLLSPKFKERQEMTRKQIALEKQERDAILEKANLETEAAELRAKASDEENYSISQRIEFLQQAQAKEQEQLEIEKQILEQKVAQLEAQLALTDSTGEELTKLNELKAQVVKINGQIAASQRSTNKEITALRRRGLSEAQQANQARLNLEKDLIQQEYDLAVQGSDDQLRLAKELRKKELEIQLDTLKSKVKNRKDYERAERLAREAYNKDIQNLDSEFAISQIEHDKEMADVRLMSYKRNSVKYYKEQLKNATDYHTKIKEQLETATEPALVEKLTKMEAEAKQAMEDIADNLTDAELTAMDRFNQLVLGTTRPMSAYYQKQIEQYNDLIEYWDELNGKFGDKANEHQLRMLNLSKERNDVIANWKNALAQEKEMADEYREALKYLNEVEKDGYHWVWNLEPKIMEQLERNQELVREKFTDAKDDAESYIKANSEAVLKDIIGAYDRMAERIADKTGQDEDELKEQAHEYFKNLFGVDEISGVTKEVADKFLESEENFNYVWDQMFKNNLLPEAIRNNYVEAMQGFVDSEKELLQQRYDNWKDTSDAIGKLTSGIGDLFEVQVDMHKEALEADGKLDKKERKILEDQYNNTVKPMRIAEATISTITGAIDAFTSAQKLGPPMGPIIGGINAAAVVAAGIANIAKIANTNPYKDNSSSLSGGDFQMSATVQPTVSDYNPQYSQNLTGRSDIDYINEAFGKTRLVVSVSEINEVQNRVRVVESESQF